MLSYQKNTLLSLLANFKARLYEADQENKHLKYSNYYPDIMALNIIDRNITSIEKQIKKL